MTESDINKIKEYYANKYLTITIAFGIIMSAFGLFLGLMIETNSPFYLGELDKSKQLLKDCKNIQVKFNTTQIWMKKHYMLMSIGHLYDISEKLYGTATKFQVSELQQHSTTLNNTYNELQDSDKRIVDVVKPYIDTVITITKYINHYNINWRNIFIFMSLLFLLDFALVFYIVLYMLLKTYQAIYSTLYTLICWVLEMFFEFLDLINPFTKVHIVQKKRRYRQ